MKSSCMNIVDDWGEPQARGEPVSPALSLRGRGLLPLLEEDRLLLLLDVGTSSVARDIIRRSLLEPLEAMSSNPGKCIRGRLVELIWRLLAVSESEAMAQAESLQTCAQVVELIHAGSLIVDDIEDGSRMRRGKPALHVSQGLPIALNAGNWLYFWPYELLRDLKIAPSETLYLYEHCHRTLLRAHFGQAIDLGSRIDELPQASVADACKASLQLKTGALMGFAAVLGATIAGVPRATVEAVDRFGRDLGVSLQMFDDLGNLLGRCEPTKQHEDLFLGRPSWVWACAAMHAAPPDYQEFLRGVRKLPDATILDQWVSQHALDGLTRKSAHDCLDQTYQRLRMDLERLDAGWSESIFDELRCLGDDIAKAYG